ncbi:MAG: recombinase family protein [Alphaproteobacteria bacterium]|nr:recombinase family protein [Alphaproteobacteria bacterium]
MKMKTKIAVIAVRVSSAKQGLIGDGPADQMEQLENLALTLEATVSKRFEFIQSASGELQPNQEAIDYCKNHKVDYFLIKAIDRFTRGGSYVYQHLKTQLTKYGVQLVDAGGIIGMKTVNTLDHLDIEYKWSKYNPTQSNELMEAERAKDEVRVILTRMIGAEIRYYRLGYAVCAPQLGLMNQKVETAHGKRTIRVAEPTEGPWLIKMFELRAEGRLKDEEIVDEINLMGFKTRRRCVKSAENRAITIGYKEGKPLDVKKLQTLIKNPIYAGVFAGKWSNQLPIKAQFDGLVSIETFNKANRGKITLVKDGDEIGMYKGKLPLWKTVKNKENPLFPYKNYVLCPICKNPFLASAPKSKSGKHIPIYHCGNKNSNIRKHNYLGINKIKFEETIYNILSHAHFNDEFKQKFLSIFFEEWEKRRKDVSQKTISYNNQINDLSIEINTLIDKISLLSLPEAIKSVEEKITEKKDRKAYLIQARDRGEDDEIKIDGLMNQAKYFMEHLEELLTGGSNPLVNGAMFGLLFDEKPSYEELLNGTPQLSPLFKLNNTFVSSKEEFVTPTGIEPVIFTLKG